MESDFLRFYNLHEPLEVEWRKFYRLLGKMPLEQSNFFRPAMEDLSNGKEAEGDDPPPGWYKEELDRRMGRNRNRVPTSVDQLLEDQKRVVKENYDQTSSN